MPNHKLLPNVETEPNIKPHQKQTARQAWEARKTGTSLLRTSMNLAVAQTNALTWHLGNWQQDQSPRNPESFIFSHPYGKPSNQSGKPPKGPKTKITRPQAGESPRAPSRGKKTGHSVDGSMHALAVAAMSRSFNFPASEGL